MRQPPPKTGAGAIHSATVDGTLASHPVRSAQPLLVAPTTAALVNTLALDLVPVACLTLNDGVFEFDSSFVTPRVRSLLDGLPDLRASHVSASTGQLPPLSVFGHADPVGSDTYNKILSGRRSTAIFALLTQNVDLWEKLHTTTIPPLGGDSWKTKNVVQKMRNHVGAAAAGKSTRVVMRLYMAAICPFQLTGADFLGRGLASGKADFQGCSEFNPLVLITQKDDNKLSKKDRDAENIANRRVVIYLFPPGPPIDASAWPCPRADEGDAGCRARFFSDGDKRRALGPTRRTFAESRDTFACRFYDRMAHDSPCERVLPARPGHVWLRLRILDDDENPRADLTYTLAIDGAPIESVEPLETDDDGKLQHEIPVTSLLATLAFDGTEVEFKLALEPVDTTIGLQARLSNLGYKVGAVDGKFGPLTNRALASFQADAELAVTGKPDDATRQELVARHGS